jgi:hypothetical protein
MPHQPVSKLHTVLSFQVDRNNHSKASARKLVVSTSRWTERHLSSFRIVYVEPDIEKTGITKIVGQMFETPAELNTPQKAFFAHVRKAFDIKYTTITGIDHRGIH